MAPAPRDFSGSGGLKVWDCATGEERYSRWQDKAVQAVAFFPDGRALAAGTADGAVNVLDLATGAEQRLPLSGVGAPHVRRLYCQPGGKIQAAGLDRTAGKLYLWELGDPEARRQAVPLQPSPGRVRDVAFSPDGKILAAGGEDGSIKLWDWETRQLVRESPFHPLLRALAFSPDGRTLALARAGVLEFWDTRPGSEPRSVGIKMPIECLAFSPDGNLLATAFESGVVTLWRVSTGGPVQWVMGHTAEIKAVAFSPDGDVVVSASYDTTVRLWDVSRFRGK